MKRQITAAEVLEVYDYEKETGQFLHRRRLGGVSVGSPAGTKTLNGYLALSVNGKRETSARLVWLVETGGLPQRKLHHKDGNSSNTRFSNLELPGSFASHVAHYDGKGVKPMPSMERLEFLFCYDGTLGCLKNKVGRGSSKKGERPGFSARNGYRYIDIDGEKYTEHRLVWYMLTGEEAEVIDHIDQDGNNNKVENLRSGTQRQNMGNTKKRKSKLGVTGVRFMKGRAKPYLASIGQDGGRVKCLGYFKTPEEAHEAFRLAHIERHGEYSKYYDHTPVRRQEY